MKIKLKKPKPDKTRDRHEWFAWYPIIAKESGFYTVNNYKADSEYVIWWRYVMRQKVSSTDLTWWIYEVR